MKRVIPIFILLVINSCIKKLDEQHFVLQGDCDEIRQFVQDSIIKQPEGVYYGEIVKDSIGCTLVVKYDGSKGDVMGIEKKLIEKKWLVKVDSINAHDALSGEVVEKVVVNDSVIVVNKLDKLEVRETIPTKKDTVLALATDTLKEIHNNSKDTILP